jgi:glutamine phosphoribosylpyrophosphate amidotransferase
MDGLRRLEYRGYDSAGLALGNNGSLEIRKAVGRIENLATLLSEDPVHGNRGICHTRWATHGAVTADNAHPHTDQSGRIVLVHNGVIENYQKLREELEREGHVFHSQTDTEVLAHLIGKYAIQLGEPSADHLVEAVRMALREVHGTYGIAVMHRDVPDLLIGARRNARVLTLAPLRFAMYGGTFDLATLTAGTYALPATGNLVGLACGGAGQLHGRHLRARQLGLRVHDLARHSGRVRRSGVSAHRPHHRHDHPTDPHVHQARAA